MSQKSLEPNVMLKIKEYYQYFKNWFWTLSVWKRAILSSIIGAFGGSSLIGFFNTYALYFHAMSQGFRVPVEGVGYINLAVSLVSFSFILVSTLGSLFIYGILVFMTNYFANFIKKRKDVGKHKIMKRIIFFFITVIIVFIIQFIASYFWYDLSMTDRAIIVYPSFLILGFFIHISSESTKKIITLLIVIIGIIGITVSLFNQNIYKTFLSKIQYGGEIPIQIEYRKSDNTEAKLNGLLLIRTNKSITIKNKSTSNLEEVPMDRVSKIILIKN